MVRFFSHTHIGFINNYFLTCIQKLNLSYYLLKVKFLCLYSTPIFHYKMKMMVKIKCDYIFLKMYIVTIKNLSTKLR